MRVAQWIIVLAMAWMAGIANVAAQTKTITMQRAIMLAQQQSIASMVNRNVFASAYWSYRAYRAERLPSLSFGADLANFNRSLVALQNSETGNYAYRENYAMNNTASLSLSQNITATGGTIKLYSSLNRLDQFTPTHSGTFYAQPISLSYIQPLWSFNRFKWSKKIEPKNFEAAKREYLESMESVTINAASYFWSYVSSRMNYDMAIKNFDNSKILYRIACERYRLGAITKDALLQTELRMLNDSLDIAGKQVALTSACNRLCSYIGYTEGTALDPVVDYSLPDLTLDHTEVVATALANSSFAISQEIAMLEADRAIAQAKANRGISAQINANFGLSNTHDQFVATYRNLRDQEIVGVSLSVPILDWGLGKGRVKMAEAQAETTRNRQEQEMVDYQQEITLLVMKFNNQRLQCDISRRAAELAEESYRMSVENFSRGTISITDMNAAQAANDAAMQSYIANLNNFWNYYYTIRRHTLFDYITRTDISAEFDKLVE